DDGLGGDLLDLVVDDLVGPDRLLQALAGVVRLVAQGDVGRLGLVVAVGREEGPYATAQGFLGPEFITLAVVLHGMGTGGAGHPRVAGRLVYVDPRSVGLVRR